MAMSTDSMIDILFGVVFFVALIPTIATTVKSELNLTGAAKTLILLVPLIVVIVFVRSIVKKKMGGR